MSKKRKKISSVRLILESLERYSLNFLMHVTCDIKNCGFYCLKFGYSKEHKREYLIAA